MSDSGQTPEECKLAGRSCLTCQDDCLRGAPEENELQRQWKEQQEAEGQCEPLIDDSDDEEPEEF